MSIFIRLESSFLSSLMVVEFNPESDMIDATFNDCDVYFYHNRQLEYKVGRYS